MLEEIFFEIGLAVVAAIALGFWLTIHEFRKFVMRKRGKKIEKEK